MSYGPPLTFGLGIFKRDSNMNIRERYDSEAAIRIMNLQRHIDDLHTTMRQLLQHCDPDNAPSPTLKDVRLRAAELLKTW